MLAYGKIGTVLNPAPISSIKERFKLYGFSFCDDGTDVEYVAIDPDLATMNREIMLYDANYRNHYYCVRVHKSGDLDEYFYD